MSAHTPVLPPAATSALEIDEPAAATVVGTGAANSSSGRVVAETIHVRSTAAAVVRETVEAAERAQQTGRNHVELRVQTSDDESLRVHLRWHDGVVHARFVTHSTELQQALSREWDLAAPRMAEKGLKFGEASFEQRDQQGQSSSQNAFSFDQQRHSSRGQGQAFAHAEEQKFTLPSAVPAVGAARQRSSAASAEAAPAPVTTSNTDVRNLRAWA